MSNLPSYATTTATTTTTRPMSDPDESISVKNNNVINKANQQQQEQEQQQQQHHDPPYLIRHSRAFRHFKNPPQPHMCIKDHTDDGQELFINVMSWTKICMPHSATDPIPLYGGMRVTSGSPKSPSLVFAVMANPAILKHVGRKCSDVEEKYALVKLMCDFVEAMNPGLKLARDAEVLKDRDLSGELKDIWGAVQAKRLREKDSAPSYESYLATQNQIYIDFGPEAPPYQLNAVLADTIAQTPTNDPQSSSERIANDMECSQLISSVLNVDEIDNNLSSPRIDGVQDQPDAIYKLKNNAECAATKLSAHQNGMEDEKNHAPTVKNDLNKNDETISSIPSPLPFDLPMSDEKASSLSTTAIATQSINVNNSNNSNSNMKRKNSLKTKPQAMTITVAPTATSNATTPTSTASKKDKLSGFLPNGCHNIFPFIKAKNSSSHEKNAASKEKSGSVHQNDQNQVSRKSFNNKDNKKLIQNCDTANLESEFAKIDMAKAEQ